ncbi:class I SAM-dependent methyltransferase [Clostridium scatologenes]|uniref:Methyltransferase type 12 n=1 Tax=Clostridium scatologenes TaxID=1548 RepID=A0A0E3GRH0_CLOSL|nr:class I SAM-dependent methyltransferase [Clostridium scatologenes]AKA70306.1 methyltransferase type 12 [Clostridium scatologenes]
MFGNSKIVSDEKYGYKRIEPIPTSEELKIYYEKRYYDVLKQRGNKDSTAKLLDSEEGNSQEIEWLKNTYFEDACDVFYKYIKKDNPELLDVGCGTGEMLEYFKSHGYIVQGIEPSEEAFDISTLKDIQVYNGDLDMFFQNNNKKFDCINLTNVLEHIVHPEQVLLKCRKMLQKQGIIRIKVPNDYSVFQEIADNIYELNKWWVCIPDHVNYFNFKSMEKLLLKTGYNVVYKTTDFPMELFLLMGDNYVKEPHLGKESHKRRMNFELSIPKETRRKFYDHLSEIEIGREIIIYAIKQE